MPRARHENQALRSGKRRENASRMLGWGFGVGRSVDEQHGSLDLRGSQHGAYRVNSKVPLLFRKLKGPLDDASRKEESRSVTDNAQVRW